MNRRKKLKYIRIITYIIILIFLINLKFIDTVGKCYIKENLGMTCPSCGITRAMKAILNLDIRLAVQYNAYFTLILLPIFVILLIDDVICVIANKKSFIEIILGE